MDQVWFGRNHWAENETLTIGEHRVSITERYGDGKPGARLWPASVALAQVVDETWRPNWQTAELGCGTGLPGMIAAKCGADVTFYDDDRAVRDWMRITLFQNAIRGNVQPLNWRTSTARFSIDAVLGSELIYTSHGIPELAKWLASNWNGTGPCLLANSPTTVTSELWLTALADSNLQSTKTSRMVMTPDGRDFTIEIWELKHGG